MVNLHHSRIALAIDLVNDLRSLPENGNNNERTVKNIIINVSGYAASSITMSVGYTASVALGTFASAFNLGLGVTVYWAGFAGTIVISDKAGEHMKDFVEKLFDDAENTPPIRIDPIVFDLNGDGLKTTTVGQGTYFDHNNDGFAESSAWADYNDGVLAVDTNANGVIDNGSELVLSLNSYDTNADGVINSSDTSFSDLKILKGDGTLQTLTEANIASINLSQTTTNTTDANGNVQKWTGSYTKTDSTTASFGDYDFLVNNTYSIETSTIAVSDEIAELPDISSYGTVYSLHQAMARDTSGELQGLVEDFVAETDLGVKRTILTDIIYKWTGADLVSSTSRGASIDGQKLYALEKFMGENFVGVGNTTNPNQQAANILNSAYANLSEYIYAQLESQSGLKDLYDLITLEYDSTTSNITMNLSAVTTYLQNAFNQDLITAQIVLRDFDSTFKTLGLKDNSNYSEFYNTFASMGSDYKLILDTSDKTVIYGTTGNDSLDGTANGEAYIAGDGNDTIYSRQGDDIVYAGSGDDYVDSCEGKDTVYGSDGNDTIVDSSGNNYLYGDNGNDSIVAGAYNKIYGGSGDDTITTISSSYSYLDGGDGNDSIIGGGNDNSVETLIGGIGNDYINGHSNHDLYIFNLGDGNDTVYDNPTQYTIDDTIKFGEGITKENIIFNTQGNDLIVTYTNSTDSVRVIDFFYRYSQNNIENFVFADGTSYNFGEVLGLSAVRGTGANDTLSGSDQSEKIYGYSGDDSLEAGACDTVYGGEGNDTLTATQFSNYLDGGDGNDSIIGGGNDNSVETLIGGIGNDYINGHSNHDLYIFNLGDGNDTVYDNPTQYTIDDTIKFGEGITKENIIFNTQGNDLIVTYTNSTDSVRVIDFFYRYSQNNIENFVFADGTSYNFGEVLGLSAVRGTGANDTLSGSDQSEKIYGYSGDDSLEAGACDTVYGGEGNDTLTATQFSNYLDGGDGNDSIIGGGNDNSVETLIGGIGNDYIHGGSSSHVYIFNIGDGNDTIFDENYTSNGRTDTIKFGEGITKENIIFASSNSNLVITFTNSTDSITVEYGTYWRGYYQIENYFFADGSSYTYNDVATIISNSVFGTENNDTLIGTSSDNYIYGVSGDDSILGNSGNDKLYGGDGNDTYSFNSGYGNDLIIEASGNDVIDLSSYTKNSVTFSFNGNDLVIANADSNSITVKDWLVSDSNKIETILFSDGIITSTQIDNTAPTATLTSATLNEDSSVVLDVLASASDIDGDILNISEFTQGAHGIISKNADNKLVYTPNLNYNGVDTFNYTIDDGNGGTITNTLNLTINAVNDAPTATLTSATLDEDTSVILDVLSNATDIDGDTLTIASFTQGAHGTLALNQENKLVYTPTANYNGTDSFTYTISDGSGGLITQTLDLQINQVNDAPTASLTSATLNEDSSVILDVLANASDIDGDTLTITSFTQGGNGSISLNSENKLIYVPNTHFSGNDTFNYTISDGNGANVTKTVDLNITPLPVNITGGSANDILIGNYKDNIVDGGIGADTMAGCTGNDTYYVDNTGDIVTENMNEGTDVVNSSITYTLGNNLENLILTGNTNINGTGNSLNNYILGNSGNNILNGGTGTDTMIGSTGNDTYYVDNTGDIVTENTNEGTDVVNSSIAYTLGNNLENLILTGNTNINGTGNSLNNYILGNSGNNIISAGAGNDIIDGGTGLDTMLGGTGNDTYYVDNTGDVVTENVGEGTDTVNTSINNYTLANNVENLSILGSTGIQVNGNTLANIITGNSGNDSFWGGMSGSDTYIGGLGNDVYYAKYNPTDNDVIIENPGEGIDTVYSWDTCTLGNNLENLVLYGPLVCNGTGNTLNNVITGNDQNNTINGMAGNDTLNGGTGADTMVGGIGNDTYYVDNTGDVVTENVNEGTDAVNSSITYSLGVNVENLILTGTNAINGTGNTLDNYIVGNAADNIINPGDGNDTIYGELGNDTIVEHFGANYLDGGDGNDSITSTCSYTAGYLYDDTITGGKGNDYLAGGIGWNTYLFNIGDGNDTIADTGAGAGGGSKIIFGAGITKSNIKFIELNNNSNDILITFTNSTDSILLKNQINVQNIATLLFADGTSYTAAQFVTMLELDGTNGNDTITNTIGFQGIYGLAGDDSIIGSPGGDYIYGGDGNDSILAGLPWGGSGNNYLDGGNGNDTLSGGTGNDTMIGGSGNDTLWGMDGNDTYYGGTGNDILSDDWGGDDTYVYNLGDGQDYVHDLKYTASDLSTKTSGGNDTITFGVGIAFSDLKFEIVEPYSLNLVITNTKNPTDIITINNQFESSKIFQIENFKFADGSVYTVNNLFVGTSNTDSITGTSGNDILYGNAGNDSIYAGAGNDTLWGGAGDDFLNSEAGNDIIYGGDGNDYMGGLNEDTAYGGLGDDTFSTYDAGDVSIEYANEGIDLLKTGVSNALSDNIENLFLYSGYGNINGTGNSLNNYITGNEGNNVINGLAGNDTLDGGAGNDTYIFNIADGNDTISDSAGTDTVSFASSVSKNNIGIFMSGTDLVVDYGSTIGQDKIVVLGQTNSATAVEKIQLSDGTYISNTDVNQLIQTMTAYATANSIQMTSVADVKNNQDLMTMVASSWHS